MGRDVEGKIVLITGAAGGIGAATARRFAADGAAGLLLSDLPGAALDDLTEELADACPSTALASDLSTLDGCERLVAHALDAHGRVDALVATAAGTPSIAAFTDTDEGHWRRELALQLDASFFLGRALARRMVQAGRGSMTFTSSIASLGAGRGMVAYVTAKTGLLGLVRTMAVELAPHGVRVNAVSPGAVDTPRYRARFDGDEQALAAARGSFAPAPMGRMCTPEEVAAAFAFLASDDASYITGHNLIVDGGTTAQVRTPDD